jgi:hypothetical protein
MKPKASKKKTTLKVSKDFRDSLKVSKRIAEMEQQLLHKKNPLDENPVKAELYLHFQ